MSSRREPPRADARLLDGRAAPPASSSALSGAWAVRGAARRAHRRQQHRRIGLLLHRRRAALLHARRRARAGDARAAGGPEQRPDRPRDLQPALHDARHGDDVPVRRAGGARRSRSISCPGDARRARPAVSAPVRLRVLGLRYRRAGVLLHAVLRRGARRRLVHVPAAHEPRAIRPGMGADFWLLGDRLHRDLGHRRRDRAHRRRSCARARRACRSTGCRSTRGRCSSSAA